MSLKFAKDEKVIRSFTYAATGYNRKKDTYDTSKSLIVTNKRLIHESVCEKRGNEVILRQEMPVADAKYVKTTMGKTSTPKFLLLALLFAVISVGVAFVSTLEAVAKFNFVFWILAAPFAILAIVKLCNFFASCSKVVSFSVFTDHIVTPVLYSTAIETNTDENAKKKAQKEPALEISVNASIAREIADGLGAAILDAINYTEETVPATKVEEAVAKVEEIKEDVPAFATVETEEVLVDVPAAEEEKAEEVVEEV